MATKLRNHSVIRGINRNLARPSTTKDRCRVQRRDQPQ
jgi:hypothetical protein